MRVTSKIQVRKKPRLEGYDYSQPGGYFITTNIAHPEIFLSSVDQGQISLTTYGQIVETCWLDLPRHYPKISVNEYCVMPDHFHGIIIINDSGSGGSSRLIWSTTSQANSPDKSLANRSETRHYINYIISEIVRAFKSFSARRINLKRQNVGQNIWQRSFYDRIIRDEADLNRIREYIMANPFNWE